MSAAHARLTIIKKNGNLGGVCPMDDSQLIIGRRAPLQHSHPAPLAKSCECAPPPGAEPCVPHRNRDPESCDIQIRLPEVSKRQAKIVSDNKDKVTELHTHTQTPLRPGRAVASNPTIAPPQVWLVNMSKTNPGGTILNSEPLQEDERRELNNNDVVQVCGRRFLFSCGAPRPTPAHQPSRNNSTA